MKILVVGDGAREHALLQKLAMSTRSPELFVVPGNGGMETIATRVSIPGERTFVEECVDLAKNLAIDLTIVGPELGLIHGIVDTFMKEGLRIFGPTAQAAQLEGSKSWAKGVMQRVGVPTASWRAFENKGEARSHAESLQWHCVIKADGPAKGKGSFICRSLEDVDDALTTVLGEHKFGSTKVLVEELLEGEELSVFAITDGETVLPFGAAQDHKRRDEGDHGPNTGGMGAYSPVHHMDVAKDFAESFFTPIVRDLANAGRRYVGMLYAGAIVTNDGPKILEFNSRFGDPEAEVLLSRLDADLLDYVIAATERRLYECDAPSWTSEEAVCVVVSTSKYPEEDDFGTPISGISEAEALEGVLVFHAGTERTEERTFVTNGGRILAITGLGPTFETARDRAYKGVACIQFEGMYFRNDIGARSTTAVFGAELRKPPRWELRARRFSDQVRCVATEIEQFETQDAEDQAVLRALGDRLRELALVLSPEQIPAEATSQTQQDVAILNQLEAEFDELYASMQTPEAAAAVASLFAVTGEAGRSVPKNDQNDE